MFGEHALILANKELRQRIGAKEVLPPRVLGDLR
jgi:hypothetical protein